MADNLLDNQASQMIRGAKAQQADMFNLALARGAQEADRTPAKATPNTRFLSSLLYNLGNISCIVSGIQRGRHNPDGKFTMNDISELMVGVSFSVGDVLMAAVSKDAPSEIERLEHGLKDHLQRHRIKLPAQPNAENIHKSGALPAVYDFIKNNIVSIKCITEGTAGLFMINAATKKGNLNKGKLAAGLLVSTGWFSTLLMNHLPPPDAASSLPDKIRDNPKGWIARPAAIGNNISNFIGAVNERKRFMGEVHAAEAALQTATAEEAGTATEKLRIARLKQHDYIWNMVSACSFLMANYLFGISSGGNKPATSAEEQAIASEVVNISAKTLASIPAEMRDAAVNQAAIYTAKQSHVGESRERIAEMIQEQIRAFEKTAPQPALAR
ncbi:hypothetical protein GC177_03860 [bacterium]|nr:hypothetical protein [bacterium]